MNKLPRVVVTGVGLITSIGVGKESFWKASLEGRSGGQLLEFPWADGRFSTRVGAPVEGFSPADFEIAPREADLLDRVSQYALAGSLMALRDAGFQLQKGSGRRSPYVVSDVDPGRLAVIMGTGIGGLTTTESSHHQWVVNPGSPLKRYHLPMLMPNAPAAQVAIRFGAQGECKMVATACASGTMGTGDAFRAIRLGEADVVITGGVEALMPDHDGWSLKGFDMLKAMSTRNHDPERASRPFDRQRDGFVMSEGSGVLILEKESFARARGAHIYAEILGYEANCDAYHIVMLEPEGRQIVQLMAGLLQKTGVGAKEVGYINAHGTSTPLNDRAETACIRRVFGKHADDLLVSSTKSMTGHAIGASGGIEAAATALAIDSRLVPPTINYEHPDPECDLNYVPNRPVEQRIDIAMTNSYGFGGHNASLMMARYQ
jgi:3-oxoacyl-[acyl-carrier-protein] synthase II